MHCHRVCVLLKLEVVSHGGVSNLAPTAVPNNTSGFPNNMNSPQKPIVPAKSTNIPTYGQVSNHPPQQQQQQPQYQHPPVQMPQYGTNVTSVPSATNMNINNPYSNAAPAQTAYPNNTINLSNVYAGVPTAKTNPVESYQKPPSAPMAMNNNPYQTNYNSHQQMNNNNMNINNPYTSNAINNPPAGGGYGGPIKRIDPIQNDSNIVPISAINPYATRYC